MPRPLQIRAPTWLSIEPSAGPDPDGSLSDMVNKTRAKDVAWGLAENAVYLGKAA
jgi:hypothetical protein